MKFEEKDNVIVVSNFRAPPDPAVEQIAAHTANTWQAGRSAEERLRDTRQGKVSEYVFQEYLNKVLGIQYVSYDEFRADGLEKHAPMDGIIYPFGMNSRIVTCFKDMINAEVRQQRYPHISPQTLIIMGAANILSVEIKSTKVTSRHKRNQDVIAEIIQDDFLTYPHHLRTTTDISTVGEYAQYLLSRGIIHAGEGLVSRTKNEELKYMHHLYVRVYLDLDLELAYLVGFVERKPFINAAVIKKMSQPGKSEFALYLSCPMLSGRPMSALASMLYAR